MYPSDYGLLGLTFSPPIRRLPVPDAHNKKRATLEHSKKVAMKDTASKLDKPSESHASEPSAPNVDLSDHGLLGITFSPPIPDVPVPDVHNKREVVPHRTRMTAIKGFASAIEAAKRFQQVTGQQKPVPFVCPPEIPQDLEHKFLAGLEEYGLDHRTRQMYVGLDALSKAASMQDRMPQPGMGMERMKLPDILEEKKSSDKSFLDTEQEDSFCYAPPGRQSNSISTLDDLGPYATAPFFGQPRSSIDGYGTSNTDVGDTLDTSRPFPVGNFGSSSALADSTASRPGSPTNATGRTTASTFSQAPKIDDTCSMNAKNQPASRSLSLLAPTLTRSDAAPADTSKQPQYHSTDASNSKAHRIGRPAKALFPSPRVGVQSGKDGKDASSRFASAGHAAERTFTVDDQFHADPCSQPQSMTVPQIRVAVPSRKNMPSSKKRKPSFLGEDSFGLPSKGARADDSTGLPTVPIEAKGLWKVQFPGNTHALLTILLTWSLKMQTLHKRLPNVNTFPLHSAFPFPISPPVHNRVISVSFYDTSVQPHREVRFLGLGDAAEMAYGEVDTFRSEQDSEARPEDDRKQKSGKLMRTLGLNKPKEGQHTDTHHRAATGEGRWCYILFKGHQNRASETAPHVILAWHKSAVTESSTHLHTIMPDGDIPAPLARPPPNPSLKRYVSLRNLWISSHSQQSVNRVLRTVSSSKLPQVEAANITPQGGSQTLERTMLKLSKAGSIPLIEGYRVDTAKFKPWMDAVGRGQGGVTFWRERG